MGGCAEWFIKSEYQSYLAHAEVIIIISPESCLNFLRTFSIMEWAEKHILVPVTKGWEKCLPGAQTQHFSGTKCLKLLFWLVITKSISRNPHLQKMFWIFDKLLRVVWELLLNLSGKVFQRSIRFRATDVIWFGMHHVQRQMDSRQESRWLGSSFSVHVMHSCGVVCQHLDCSSSE